MSHDREVAIHSQFELKVNRKFKKIFQLTSKKISSITKNRKKDKKLMLEKCSKSVKVS